MPAGMAGMDRFDSLLRKRVAGRVGLAGVELLPAGVAVHLLVTCGCGRREEVAFLEGVAPRERPAARVAGLRRGSHRVCEALLLSKEHKIVLSRLIYEILYQ